MFETPWSCVSPALTEADQAWLLNEAAFRLRALGRLTESLEPTRAGLENYVKQGNWKHAAIIAGNLSELELTLGEMAGAVADAEQSVSHADRSGDAFQRMGKRTTHANALDQAGRGAEAEARFREAEQMQAERQPAHPLLYGVAGFRYCDLLLSEAERAAWQVTCNGIPRPPEDGDAHSATLQSVSDRAAQMLKMAPSSISASSTSRSTTSPWAAPRSTRPSWRACPSTLAIRPSSTPWTASAAPARKTISPAGSSPAPGCGVSKAITPARTARRAT